MSKNRMVRPFRPDRVRVVCFDLNETLVAWNDAFHAGFRDSLEEWLGRWNGDETVSDVTTRLLNHYKEARRGNRDRLSSIRSAMRTLPISVDDRTVSFIAGRIRELQPKKAKWITGAEETLEGLSKQYRLGVITNLDRERAYELWDRLRMNRFIKKEDMFTPFGGIRKPNERIFKKTADAIGEEPRRCMMVGDSYRRDAQGAARAGWQAVWITKKARQSAAHSLTGGRAIYVVPSIQALPRLFLH